MSDEPPGVGLAEAIDLVRAELQKAAEAGAHSPIAFRPVTVDLEFEIVFSRVEGTEVGVRAWVVSLGAKAEASAGRTQRLKVSLVPVDRPTGQPPLVSDQGNR